MARKSLMMGALLAPFSLVASEINVKLADGQATAQIVAGAAETPVTPVTARNIKIERQKSTTNQLAFPVQKDDLVNNGAASLLSVDFTDFAPLGQCNAAALNDGELGTPSFQGAVTFDLDGTWTTTFKLNLAQAPQGYTIREIRTIAGWPANRACQKYELSVAKVAAPDQFISLGFFELDAENAVGSQLSLTNSEGALENNVAALKFSFMVPASVTGGATATAYREIDILGEVGKP